MVIFFNHVEKWKIHEHFEQVSKRVLPRQFKNLITAPTCSVNVFGIFMFLPLYRTASLMSVHSSHYIKQLRLQNVTAT